MGVVWGMPGFVAQAGLADKILPLDQIAARDRPIHDSSNRRSNPLPSRLRKFQLAFRKTVEIAVIEERCRLLHKLQNLEHALAAFAVDFPELHGYP